MDTGMLLTRGTAVLAFLFYVLAFTLHFRHSWSRTWWTLSCTVFVIHVLCAFHFIHHWSHADAYASTARETYALAGINWGGGVYFNYVFTAVWVIDVLWWWSAPRSHQLRSRITTYALHGFVLFMWFNGTVVFGHGVARWVGVGAFVLLGIQWVQRRKKRQNVLSV
jgi:hypothetical protein